MFKLKTQHIKDFPFQEYAQIAEPEGQGALAKSHNLSAFNSWMLPQISAHYGAWELVYSGNKIDPKATAKLNAGSDLWELGLWRVLTQLRRGDLVKSQLKDANYSALVPIILASVKKFQGVKYSSWNIEPNCPLVDKNLLDAMLWRNDELYEVVADEETPGTTRMALALGSDELLAIREQGLTIKTGSRAGTVQKPTSSWCLKGIGDTVLGTAPKLVSTMLAQIWVAHPSIRTEYMILDPYDWDHMPSPIATAEVFAEEFKSAAKAPNYATDLPW